MSYFVKELTKNIKGDVLPQEPLKRHTTWRIGGPAEVMVIPKNRQDVETALRIAVRHRKKVTVMGNGSNLLVSETGVNGLVLKLVGGLTEWHLDGPRLTAESGCLLPGLSRASVEAGLAGLEFAAGIPASLGGALVMNAGAHGVELGALVGEVLACTLSGEQIRLARQDCGFAYRKSVFQQGGLIVLGAVLELGQGERDKGYQLLKSNLAKRAQSQPLEYPSAGSVFRNPPEAPAAKLIEAAGAKGLRIGGAMVSDKHANFIVNVGEATASDVLTLIETVKEMVVAKFDIELHPEIRTLGCSRD